MSDDHHDTLPIMPPRASPTRKVVTESSEDDDPTLPSLDISESQPALQAARARSIESSQPRRVPTERAFSEPPPAPPRTLRRVAFAIFAGLAAGGLIAWILRQL